MRPRTYTIHLPVIAMRGDAQALDRAQIVPDGFSWPAFAFTALWFFRYRLWLAAALVVLLFVGLAVIGRLIGLSPIAAAAITVLASILVGLEASSLRRWTYARDGRPARDAVIAGSLDEAEAKAVARWLDPDAGPRSAAHEYGRFGRSTDDSIIGMFPASEGGR